MLEFNATFLVAMISFAIFIFIMNIILYKPILNIIRKRNNYIESNYNESDKFNNKTNVNVADYNQKLEKAKEEGRIEGAKALDAVQKKSFEQIQTAKNEAKIELENRKNILQNEKEFLQNQVRDTVENDLYSVVMSKIFEGHKIAK